MILVVCVANDSHHTIWISTTSIVGIILPNWTLISLIIPAIITLTRRLLLNLICLYA